MPHTDWNRKGESSEVLEPWQYARHWLTRINLLKFQLNKNKYYSCNWKKERKDRMKNWKRLNSYVSFNYVYIIFFYIINWRFTSSLAYFAFTTGMKSILYTPVSLEKLVAGPPGIREDLLIKSDCKKLHPRGQKHHIKLCTVLKISWIKDLDISCLQLFSKVLKSTNFFNDSIIKHRILQKSYENIYIFCYLISGKCRYFCGAH